MQKKNKTENKRCFTVYVYLDDILIFSDLNQFYFQEYMNENLFAMTYIHLTFILSEQADVDYDTGLIFVSSSQIRNILIRTAGE